MRRPRSAHRKNIIIISHNSGKDHQIISTGSPPPPSRTGVEIRLERYHEEPMANYKQTTSNSYNKLIKKMRKSAKPFTLQSIKKSYPFKNRRWLASQRADPNKKRGGRNLKQIMAGENVDSLVEGTYYSLEAPPSLLPVPKYCDITGFTGHYTDRKSTLRYFSSILYRHIQHLPPPTLHAYLAIRNASLDLK